MKRLKIFLGELALRRKLGKIVFVLSLIDYAWDSSPSARALTVSVVTFGFNNEKYNFKINLFVNARTW